MNWPLIVFICIGIVGAIFFVGKARGLWCAALLLLPLNANADEREWQTIQPEPGTVSAEISPDAITSRVVESPAEQRLNAIADRMEKVVQFHEKQIADQVKSDEQYWKSFNEYMNETLPKIHEEGKSLMETDEMKAAIARKDKPTGSVPGWLLVVLALCGVAVGVLMTRALKLWCLLLFFVPLNANAATMLLELGWDNQPQTLPAVYAFSAANEGGSNFALWEERVTSYPFESVASPEIVDRFDYILAGPTISDFFPIMEMVILNDFINDGGHVLQGPERPALCTSCRWHRLMGIGDQWRTGPEWSAFAESVGWNVDLRVPLLGLGLRGYTITALERTVTADAQTIRLYGVVPEPASWLLVLCGLTIHLRKRWKLKD